jgi:putative ABC transport system permease protein
MRNDLRSALRRITRNPGFTAIIVLTLALGVGATTAAFSLVNGVLLTPLPYDDPSGLAMVWERNLERDVPRNVVSPANYLRWVDDMSSFDRLAAVAQFGATLTGEGEAERVGTVSASWFFFDMLGVRPALGRSFVEAEGDPGTAITPVILSDGFWHRRFGGDPAVVGRQITLNGDPAEIVGVLPAGFDFDHLPFEFGWDGPQEIWVPQSFPEGARNASGRWIQVVGRLAPGATLGDARREAAVLAARYQQDRPETQAGWDINVVPLHEQVVGNVQRALWLVLAAVGLVLTIAAANVANLQLARSLSRGQELAVRVAMGAPRSRVVREELVESVVLAGLGGGLGILLAVAGVDLVQALGPDIPRLDRVEVDLPVLAFTLVVSIGTGVLFGLVPALRAGRAQVSAALKEGSARSGTSRGSTRFRSALVVAEMALSLLLLVGAGLLIRSFSELVETGVGFRTERLLAADLNLTSNAYPEPEDQTAFYQRLVDRAAALPGVEAASAITFLPLAGTGSATSFWANDRPVPGDGEKPVADIRWVHRDYHSTMGIPVLRGRTFDSRDTEGAPLRVVVNRSLAEEFWPGEDPVGQRLSMPWGDTLVAEIIGVVGDVRINGPSEEPRSLIYWDHEQFRAFSGMTVVLRSAQRPEALASSLRGLVREMDASLPVFNVRTLDSYLSEAVGSARFAMAVLAVFALLALVLAAIGIYGVISYSVGQRTHEFGIRMSLGADRGDVTRLVLRYGAALAAVALVLGGGAALLATRLMRGLIFGVSPTDGLTFAATGTLLAAVALLAAWIPARRAASTDPMRALRTE